MNVSLPDTLPAVLGPPSSVRPDLSAACPRAAAPARHGNDCGGGCKGPHRAHPAGPDGVARRGEHAHSANAKLRDAGHRGEHDPRALRPAGRFLVHASSRDANRDHRGAPLPRLCALVGWDCPCHRVTFCLSRPSAALELRLRLDCQCRACLGERARQAEPRGGRSLRPTPAAHQTAARQVGTSALDGILRARCAHGCAMPSPRRFTRSRV